MSYDPREKVCPPLQPLDPYAAEKGLAKRVAHGLRGILAKLPDVEWREPNAEQLAAAQEAVRRGIDPRIGVIAATPNRLLADIPFRATPCHDWPSREDLPTANPEDADG